VVLAPRRWRQVRDDASHHADDGGKRARSPGRARRKPLTPSRGECRAFSGVTVVTNARAYYQYTRGCGRIGRPAFPAPSDHQKARNFGSTRARHAAGSRSCVFFSRRWPVPPGPKRQSLPSDILLNGPIQGDKAGRGAAGRQHHSSLRPDADFRIGLVEILTWNRPTICNCLAAVVFQRVA
jgi:hypothetical protein